jgi:hypothetical protein
VLEFENPPHSLTIMDTGRIFPIPISFYDTNPRISIQSKFNKDTPQFVLSSNPLKEKKLFIIDLTTYIESIIDEDNQIWNTKLNMLNVKLDLYGLKLPNSLYARESNLPIYIYNHVYMMTLFRKEYELPCLHYGRHYERIVRKNFENEQAIVTCYFKERVDIASIFRNVVLSSSIPLCFLVNKKGDRIHCKQFKDMKSHEKDSNLKEILQAKISERKETSLYFYETGDENTELNRKEYVSIIFIDETRVQFAMNKTRNGKGVDSMKSLYSFLQIDGMNNILFTSESHISGLLSVSFEELNRGRISISKEDYYYRFMLFLRLLHIDDIYGMLFYTPTYSQIKHRSEENNIVLVQQEEYYHPRQLNEENRLDPPVGKKGKQRMRIKTKMSDSHFLFYFKNAIDMEAISKFLSFLHTSLESVKEKGYCISSKFFIISGIKCIQNIIKIPVKELCEDQSSFDIIDSSKLLEKVDVHTFNETSIGEEQQIKEILKHFNYSRYVMTNRVPKISFQKPDSEKYQYRRWPITSTRHREEVDVISENNNHQINLRCETDETFSLLIRGKTDNKIQKKNFPVLYFYTEKRSDKTVEYSNLSPFSIPSLMKKKFKSVFERTNSKYMVSKKNHIFLHEYFKEKFKLDIQIHDKNVNLLDNNTKYNANFIVLRKFENRYEFLIINEPNIIQYNKTYILLEDEDLPTKKKYFLSFKEENHTNEKLLELWKTKTSRYSFKFLYDEQKTKIPFDDKIEAYVTSFHDFVINGFILKNKRLMVMIENKGDFIFQKDKDLKEQHNCKIKKLVVDDLIPQEMKKILMMIENYGFVYNENDKFLFHYRDNIYLINLWLNNVKYIGFVKCSTHYAFSSSLPFSIRKLIYPVVEKKITFVKTNMKMFLDQKKEEGNQILSVIQKLDRFIEKNQKAQSLCTFFDLHQITDTRSRSFLQWYRRHPEFAKQHLELSYSNINFKYTFQIEDESGVSEVTEYKKEMLK